MTVSAFRNAALALSIAGTCAFAAWNGTEATPKTKTVDGKEIFQITTPEELTGFVQLALTHIDTIYGELKNDIVFGADTAKIADKKWVRDYPTNYAFNGLMLSGEGHTIYGLNSNHGLFITAGYRGGYIKDLTLANCKIVADSLFAIGAIVEQHTGGLIENVEVRNCEITSGGPVGGIVGSHNYNDMVGNVMHNVRSVKNRISGNVKVGGIAGYAYSDISNAYNSSTITVDDSTSCDQAVITHVGGIVGDFEPTSSKLNQPLDSAVNEGDITVESCVATTVGGIVGETLRQVTNSENRGALSVVSYTNTAKAGGIAGLISKSWRVTDRWSEASVNLKNHGKVNAIGNDLVKAGGIFGESHNNALSFAINYAPINASTIAKNGVSYTGGIAGQIYNNQNDVFVQQLGNWGKIKSASTYNNHVGGVVGSLEDPYRQPIALFKAFNYGNIEIIGDINENDTARIEIGGIAGFVNDAKIFDVYNRGSINVKAYKQKYQYTGGLVGNFYSANAELSFGYSAADTIGATYTGGLVGNMRYAGSTNHVYQDTLVQNYALYADSAPWPDNGINEFEGLLNSNTKAMQSDEFLKLLDTWNGQVPEGRNIWIRRGGYPIFEFDTSGTTVATAESSSSGNTGDKPKSSSSAEPKSSDNTGSEPKSSSSAEPKSSSNDVEPASSSSGKADTGDTPESSSSSTDNADTDTESIVYGPGAAHGKNLAQPFVRFNKNSIVIEKNGARFDVLGNRIK